VPMPSSASATIRRLATLASLIGTIDGCESD
jgi:hypothetical protein